MDQAALQTTMQKVQNQMGDALTYLSVVSLETGQSLVGVYNDPRNDALIVTAFSTLAKGNETIGDYTVIDTKDQVLSTIQNKKYLLILGFRKDKMTLGMFMDVILVKLIEEIKAVLV